MGFNSGFKGLIWTPKAYSFSDVFVLYSNQNGYVAELGVKWLRSE